jgi:peptidoglycan/LPS O-acetylase OafA/YrhL
MSAHRPDIDGLRALAILPVVLFHVGGTPLVGGYVGVDVFFVISGFLIAGTIDQSLSKGAFALSEFYVQRFRRLWPAMVFMLAVMSAMFAVVLAPVDLKAYGQSVLATVLSASNLYFHFKAGYFDPASELKPLLHTWSLGVEEQFYLLFPILMMWSRGWTLASRLRLLGGLGVLSFAWSTWAGWFRPDWAFYLPMSRWWELSIGACLALAAPHWGWLHRGQPWLAYPGVALLLLCMFGMPAPQGYPGWQAMLPCLGTALVLAAGVSLQQHGWAQRALANGFLQHIGRVSYSMYLWHWPLLVLARYVLFRDLEQLELLAYGLVLWLVSWVSWRWIESPPRGMLGAVRWSRPRVVSLVGVSAVAAVVWAVGLQLTHGLPQRWDPVAQELARAALDVNPLRARCDRVEPSKVTQGLACEMGQAADPSGTPIKPSYALWGDSFGDALAPGLDQLGKDGGKQGVVLTHSGCFPLLGVRQQDPRCEEFAKAAVAYLKANPEIKDVVWVSRWTSALLGTRFGQFHQGNIFITDDQSLEKSYAENRRVFVRAIERTVAELEGRRITLVAHIPEQQYDVPRALAMKHQFDMRMSVPVTVQEHQVRQRELRELLGKASLPKDRVQVLDLGSHLCDQVLCNVQSSAGVLYADDNHLSRTGALTVRQWLRGAIDGV